MPGLPTVAVNLTTKVMSVSIHALGVVCVLPYNQLKLKSTTNGNVKLGLRKELRTAHLTHHPLMC